MNIRHGEIWLVDLGIAAKTRPVVVLSSDKIDAPRSLVIYVPMTRQNRGSALEISVGHLRFLDKESVANVQGLGAIPAGRFERRLGQIDLATLLEIKKAVKLACDIDTEPS